MSRVLLTRIVEWTAWMPVEQDINGSPLSLAHGMSAFQIDDDERVMEVSISPAGRSRIWNHATGKEQQLAGPIGPRCEQQSLRAFQAILVRPATDDEVQHMEAAEKADDNGGAKTAGAAKLHLPHGYKS